MNILNFFTLTNISIILISLLVSFVIIFSTFLVKKGKPNIILTISLSFVFSLIVGAGLYFYQSYQYNKTVNEIAEELALLEKNVVEEEEQFVPPLPSDNIEVINKQLLPYVLQDKNLIQIDKTVNTNFNSIFTVLSIKNGANPRTRFVELQAINIPEAQSLSFLIKGHCSECSKPSFIVEEILTKDINANKGNFFLELPVTEKQSETKFSLHLTSVK